MVKAEFGFVNAGKSSEHVDSDSGKGKRKRQRKRRGSNELSEKMEGRRKESVD